MKSEPQDFDNDQHFAKTKAKLLLALKFLSESYGSEDPSKWQSPQIFWKKCHAEETIKQLGALTYNKAVSRDTASDAVLALVEIGLAAGQEIERLLDWREPLAIPGGPSLAPGRDLVLEIAKKREEFPVIRINSGIMRSKDRDASKFTTYKGKLKKIFEELPLRPYEMGVSRTDAVPSVDLLIRRFADHVLHYPQSLKRTRYMFQSWGSFPMGESSRRWLMEPGQRNNHNAWANTFRNCVFGGLKRMEQEGSGMEKTAAEFRNRWLSELTKKYKGQITEGSIHTTGVEALLLRRAKERFEPILKRGTGSKS